MSLASNNEFPSLLIKEGSAPSSPSAGNQRLFVDSSDHLLKLKNSGGTVSSVGAGFANPMTTAGDIIYGGASGVATRLAGGTSTYVLTSNGATSAPSWQAAAGGLSKYAPLDRSSFDATYGDDFTGGSLNGRWSRQVVGSGEESYAQGGDASHLVVAYSTGAAVRYHYQTPPAGDWTIEMAYSWWQPTATGQIMGLLWVDSSGNGCIGFLYDNASGLFLGSVSGNAYGSTISTTAWPVSTNTTSLAHAAGQRVYMRLRRTGGTSAVSFSLNGRIYSPEVSGSVAGTPARFGFGRLVGTQSGDTLAIDWFDKTA